MIELNYSELTTIPLYKSLANDLENLGPQLNNHRQNLLSREQGWLDLPETSPVTEILTYAESVQGKYKNIVILGIGGSALGITSTFKALLPLYWNDLTSEQRQNRPRLFILDNIDPALIENLEQTINPAETLFIVITKSGTTPETLSQYFYFRNKLSNAVGEETARKNFVFITDPTKGILREIAQIEGITSFSIPENVGGRFSVLTPVGLLPAALLGINIKDLLKGAAATRDNFLTTDFTNNAIYQFAAIQFLVNTKYNVNINVLMPYSSALATFADWYRQLLAESIGKLVNRQGQTVHTGITPVNALGVTDQHSQSQLYNEGPKDKLIIFLKTESNHPNEAEQSIKTSNPKAQLYQGVTFKKLLDIEYQATRESLTKYETANIELKIAQISEVTLGSLYMFFEIATGLLGELYEIDAFNQPGVELGKNLTREALSN